MTVAERGGSADVKEMQRELDGSRIMSLALGLLMEVRSGEAMAAPAETYYASSRKNKEPGRDTWEFGPAVTREQAIAEMSGTEEYENRRAQIEAARTNVAHLALASSVEQSVAAAA